MAIDRIIIIIIIIIIISFVYLRIPVNYLESGVMMEPRFGS